MSPRPLTPGEQFAQSVAANEELRAAIAEAHALIRDIRGQMKDLKQMVDDAVRAEVEKQLGTLRAEIAQDMRTRAGETVDDIGRLLRQALKLDA
jgi:hypothetical protein